MLNLVPSYQEFQQQFFETQLGSALDTCPNNQLRVLSSSGHMQPLSRILTSTSTWTRNLI